MKSAKARYASIDEYIATFPEEIQAKLEEMRATIKAAAPEAVEGISYQMPTFFQDGYLVYFAGYKNHIGFYPAPLGIDEFEKDISRYVAGKGTLQFPYSEPLPRDLIGRIVSSRLGENAKKAEVKARRIGDRGRGESW